MITSHDIVMVGGGGAGLRAAIAIAELATSTEINTEAAAVIINL